MLRQPSQQGGVSPKPVIWGISQGRQTPAKHLIVTTDDSRPSIRQTPMPSSSPEDTSLSKNNSHYRPSLENQNPSPAPSMATKVVEEDLYSPSDRSTASGSPLRAREPLV